MSALQELRVLLRLRVLQLTALAGLLAAIAYRALELKWCIHDLDIWWHLKVGDWIVQQRAVPHTGLFSRTAANRPWVAYSWGYEVLLSRAYKWFGLVGMGMFGVLLTLAVAYGIYWMLRRLSGRFWVALLLTAVTCSAFLFNIMPRPVFFSIILFCVTLALILEANRSGRIDRLYWLPLIFLFWTNLHIQFIYGLFLLGLLVGVNLTQRVAQRLGIAPAFLVPPNLPAGKLVAIFGACVAVTCINPYSLHLYRVILEYSKAKVTYAIIIELQAVNFRAGSHYMQLLLTAAGFFALGWRKKIDLYKLALLTVASVVAFRTMRDSWFICIPAAACMADASAEEAERGETWIENAVLAAVLALALFVFADATDFNLRGLDRAISSQFPVNALNYLRRNPQPGPLYNTLDWGGFLMWYMPDYPVAIDGRNDLYGDELDIQFFGTSNAQRGFETDPYLIESGVVLLQRNLPLVDFLTNDPRFQLVYQDQIAAVFVRANQGAR